jgi:hypothetical protein
MILDEVRPPFSLFSFPFFVLLLAPFFPSQFYEQYIYDQEEGAQVSAAEHIEDVDGDNVSFSFLTPPLTSPPPVLLCPLAISG